MKRRQLAFAVLAVAVTALVVALSPAASAATPAPTPVVTSPDPQCAFTNGCVSPAPSTAATDPTPNAGVRGATVSTPATGGGFAGGLVAIALIGLGLAAVVWVVRRR